ncbi:hypothetical protein CSOJ01_03862 [Colletotrichum sojae]|uniref:Protein kinase domain-containing protein n=1 Tax=Colletotrichum sojae TaxID=2175907 RepID=A0A8H6JLD5_9PEZI|nr:hypothetical protein CSOJ01_03862 [Colletotrichum sojae]
MGDRRAVPSEAPSEEKTEPFSQSEIDARLRSIRVDEPFDLPQADAVPLDKLRVEDHHHRQGIRILVRPLTRSRSVSPGNFYNCQWLALRAEVASEQEPQHKVLAVTQTSRDIKFSVRIPPERPEDGAPRPPLWCELYYDPASDNQILLNRSDVPISLARISDSPASGSSWTVNPGTPKALSPGTWRINVRDVAVLDFRVLEKRPAFFRQDDPDVKEEAEAGAGADALNASGKRSFVMEDDERTDKKPRTADDDALVKKEDREDGVIMFLRPKATPLVFPLPTEAKGRELATASGHALLDMRQEETVVIPGGCEIDEYTVTKRDQIASTALSSVFTAEHSNVPDGIVTVKVLKTRSTNPASAAAAGAASKAAQDNNERNVIRQADMWLREYQSQDDLRHDSIVRLYGGDARHLSLYMEHVDAKDLSAKGVWRSAVDHGFLGGRADALAILRDVAGALHYLHSKSLVHNDIKPANILYSSSRGAVLCDFGLSTHAGGPVTTGGTPYYIPPEFIGRKLRGPPSDVWALGVTMLYVLGKIPFPDARSRKGPRVPGGDRPLYWMIADVNRPPPPPPAGHQRQPPCSAVDMMYIWLSEVAQARDKLYPRDRLERLVSDMLIPAPGQRITMARVMRELYVMEQAAAAKR